MISCIAFAHHKGGTGKTTSCINIAGFLQKSGKRVLVVDSDPQANATSALGIEPGTLSRDIYDIYLSGCEGFDEVDTGDVIVGTESGIDCIPSSIDLAGAEPYLYERDDRARILSESLKSIEKKYDFILIDTPPSLGQFVINGLVASDRTIVILDHGIFALRGVETLKTLFSDIKENFGKEIVADIAILTGGGTIMGEGSLRGDLRRIMNRFLHTDHEEIHEKERIIEAEKHVREVFESVFVIPYDSAVSKAQQMGIPLSHISSSGDAARIYREIADEIIRSGSEKR